MKIFEIRVKSQKDKNFFINYIYKFGVDLYKKMRHIYSPKEKYDYTKRGLFKNKTLNKVWNTNLNGAVNHIKVAFKKSFKWLISYMWKICNQVKLKSAGEFYYWNSHNSKAQKEQTIPQAYRYAYRSYL